MMNAGLWDVRLQGMDNEKISKRGSCICIDEVRISIKMVNFVG
jgi:hypothetical protein